jgi:hypothetical protein
MPFSDEQVEAMKAHCAGVASCSQGTIEYLLVAGLRLPNCKPDVVDALLCFGDRGEGYPTRLYFTERVAPARAISLNWNANGVRILERNWYAFSWKVPLGLSPEETLLEHMKPLR